MYSEYVFENKRYEVALTNIKATLFDIVTQEENKIAKLREEMFSPDKSDIQEELQALFVQEDSSLREVLSLSEQLTKALQQVDSCSRDLKQIEDQKLASIVATIHDGAHKEKPKLKKIKPEPVAEDTPVVETATEQVIGDVPATEPELIMSYDDAVSTVPAPQSTPDTQPDVVMEVIDTPEDAATTAAPPSTPDTQPDVIMEVIDTPEDATKEGPPATEPELIMTYDDSVSTVKEPASTPDTQPDVVMEVIDTPEDTATTAPQSAPPEVVAKEEVPSSAPADETPSKEETIPSSGPLLTPIEESAPESSSVIPVIAPATEQTAETGPLIPPVTEPIVESGPLIPPSTAGVSDAVIIPQIISSDSVLDEAGPSSVVDAPPVIDDGGSLVLHKRGTDDAKVIMISKKQAEKLDASLSTQEAFLSAKGIFGNTGDAGLEQQLVDHGLLAPAEESVSPEDIESMMNQANALYSAGKVEEAQEMYNKISELNKKVQGK